MFDHAGGWTVRAEVSFAVFGERGSVDLLAWHAATAVLLVVELKTEIVDVGGLLATLDRKRRLAPRIAPRFGWIPVTTSVALVVSSSQTNRRRFAAHGRMIGSILPDATPRWSAYLKEPRGGLAAVAFISDRRPRTTRQRTTSTRRVVRPRKRPE